MHVDLEPRARGFSRARARTFAFPQRPRAFSRDDFFESACYQLCDDGQWMLAEEEASEAEDGMSSSAGGSLPSRPE